MTTSEVDLRERRAAAATQGIGDVVDRARAFLSREFRKELRFSVEMSATQDMRDARPAPVEVFSSMIVLELMARRALEPAVMDVLYATVRANVRRDRIHFFARPELLPADIDCTAVGVAALLEGGRIERADADSAADAIVKNVNEDGYLMTYFDGADGRDHVEPAVSTNALYLLHLLDREDEATRTQELVARFVTERGHLRGTRYYASPDTFLFFLARLCGRFERARTRYGGALTAALEERVGTTDNPLDLALRVVARQRLGLPPTAERERLLTYAQADGGFPSWAFFKTGKRDTFFGSAVLTTAFATAALDRRDAAARSRGAASPGEDAYYVAPGSEPETE